MVEIVEYIMGFGLSTVIAVFSIFVLAGSSPIIGHLLANSAGPEIADTATQAIQSNRSASVSLYLSNASVVCSNGRLSIRNGGGNFSSGIGSNCSFSVFGLSGPHRLTFFPDGSRLRVRVDS